jgi:predicted deacylase
MKNSNMSICDAIIQPGEAANLALPLPEYNSCTSFHMPIKVVHGKEAGPCILIFSGVEGNEFNGVEIINRVLKMIESVPLRGSLIAVPILNVLGLINFPTSLPYEQSLEQCFPGNRDGSYGERIANIFTQEIFAKATHCLELKTGLLNHDILPQIYCDIDNKEGKLLAKKFEAPVISHVNTSNHSLRETAESLNIPFLMYKAGEAMRFDESAIKTGIAGIQKMMTHLDMIDADLTEDNPSFKSIVSQEQDWVRAHRSGIFVTEVVLGQLVKKNQLVGRITDPFSVERFEPVKSSQDGIVVGINRNPLIYEGQNIFKLASFIDNNRAELSLETWMETNGE